MSRTRIISMNVNKITSDAFDSIVNLFPKIIPDTQFNSDGWWSFTGPYGKSKVKFDQNKFLGILDHQYIDEKSSWNISMCIIPNGNFSEVKIILKKPEQLSDSQFDQRVEKISELAISMKQIIESKI